MKRPKEKEKEQAHSFMPSWLILKSTKKKKKVDWFFILGDDMNLTTNNGSGDYSLINLDSDLVIYLVIMCGYTFVFGVINACDFSVISSNNNFS